MRQGKGICSALGLVAAIAAAGASWSAQAKVATLQPYENTELINYVVVPNNEGWDGAGLNPATIGYHFTNGTSDISGTIEQNEVLRAMQLWAKYADITWTPKTANQTVSVDVGWYTGDHGDGASFDGLGGALAHAAPPPPTNSETFAGDLHFDDAENWTTVYTSGTNLFTVAVHELGHSLGLAHATDNKSIMYPEYRGGAFGNALTPDDIAGIRALYAPKYPTFSAHVKGTHTWRQDLIIKVGVKDSVGGATLWETDVHLQAGYDWDDFDYDEIDLTDAASFANGVNDWFVSIQDVIAPDSGTLQEFSLRFGTPGNWTTLLSPDTGALIDGGTKIAYIQNVAIPEPAALSVLGLTALLLVRRARG